mmetsp:Transcript_15358/g.58056  ORF Transcript_15358/g.58056 Transcript_15358/m.58056 type:complete len:405 (-) Transcript_15358:1179-2393(-)
MTAARAVVAPDRLFAARLGPGVRVGESWQPRPDPLPRLSSTSPVAGSVRSTGAEVFTPMTGRLRPGPDAGTGPVVAGTPPLWPAGLTGASALMGAGAPADACPTEREEPAALATRSDLRASAGCWDWAAAVPTPPVGPSSPGAPPAAAAAAPPSPAPTSASASGWGPPADGSASGWSAPLPALASRAAAMRLVSLWNSPASLSGDGRSSLPASWTGGRAALPAPSAPSPAMWSSSSSKSSNVSAPSASLSVLGKEAARRRRRASRSCLAAASAASRKAAAASSSSSVASRSCGGSGSARAISRVVLEWPSISASALTLNLRRTSLIEWLPHTRHSPSEPSSPATSFRPERGTLVSPVSRASGSASTSSASMRTAPALPEGSLPRSSPKNSRKAARTFALRPARL